jgi:uncharacterized protein YndB with AHSA1/START domain
MRCLRHERAQTVTTGVPRSPGSTSGSAGPGRDGGPIGSVGPMSTIEVTEQIDAPPEQVWELVGDPVALAGLTAECHSMAWVGRTTGPAVGARFRGHNRSGWRRWTTTCVIVRYEPGSEIAWDVAVGPLAVARWSYRVEPDGQGTTVREAFEDRRGVIVRTTSPMVRGTRDTDGRNRANMTATLARVKARAEA